MAGGEKCLESERATERPTNHLFPASFPPSLFRFTCRRAAAAATCSSCSPLVDTHTGTNAKTSVFIFWEMDGENEKKSVVRLAKSCAIVRTSSGSSTIATCEAILLNLVLLIDGTKFAISGVYLWCIQCRQVDMTLDARNVKANSEPTMKRTESVYYLGLNVQSRHLVLEYLLSYLGEDWTTSFFVDALMQKRMNSR